jgi:hypothetical protein
MYYKTIKRGGRRDSNRKYHVTQYLRISINPEKNNRPIQKDKKTPTIWGIPCTFDRIMYRGPHSFRMFLRKHV